MHQYIDKPVMSFDLYLATFADVSLSTVPLATGLYRAEIFSKEGVGQGKISMRVKQTKRETNPYMPLFLPCSYVFNVWGADFVTLEFAVSDVLAKQSTRTIKDAFVIWGGVWNVTGH